MTAVEFGSLFEFIRNGMSVRQDKSGEGLPITRIETISEAVVDSSRVGYAGLEEKDCNSWLLQPGDILFSHINSVEHIGKCAVYEGTPEKLVHGMNLLCLRPDKSKLTPQFGKYLIRSRAFRTRLFNYVNKAVNQASVSIGNLKPIEVTVPSLPEQKRIAAILDKADSIRRKRQESVRLTEELLRSVFLDMFGDPVTNPKGWTVVKLKDTFDLKPQIGTIVPADERGKQLVVRVGELGKVDVALDRCKSVTLSGQELKRFYLSSGDFLLARAIGSADHLGKASIFQETSAPVVFDSHVMRLRFKNNVIHSTFFYEWLKSTGGKSLFMRRAGQTAVQFNVNSEQIGEIEIPLPPYLIQMKFVALFEKVRKLYKKTNCTLEGSTQLFNSLLQRAFKGEL